MGARGRGVVATEAVVVQVEGTRRRHLIRLQRPPALGAPRGGYLRAKAASKTGLELEHTLSAFRDEAGQATISGRIQSRMCCNKQHCRIARDDAASQ